MGGGLTPVHGQGDGFSGGRLFVPGQVLVAFEEAELGLMSLNSDAIPEELTLLQQFTQVPGLSLLQVGAEGDISLLSVESIHQQWEEMKALLDRLNNDPAVRYAQPNYIYLEPLRNVTRPAAAH